MTTESSCSTRSQTVVKSPGVPREAPVDRRRARARHPGHRRARARLAARSRTASSRSPAPTARRPSTELLGHVCRAAGRPVAVAGNVGTPARLAGRRARRRRRPSSARLELPARGLRRLRARVRGAAQRRARPPRPPRHARGLPRRRSCGSSPTRATTTSPSTTAHDPALAAATSAAARGGSPSAADARRDPDCELEPRRRGDRLRRASRSSELGELQLLGPHNVENAMARGRGGSRDRASTRDAVADGPAQLRGRPPPARARCASVGGVLYVNDSKATNVAAARGGDRWRSTSGVHVILGGTLKGETLRAASPGRSRERCAAVYLIGEAARALDRRPRRRPGDGGVDARDVRHARARRGGGRGRAQPGEVVLLAPACASFDAYRDYEAARRALPRARGGALDELAKRVAAIGPRRRAARRRSSTRCC